LGEGSGEKILGRVLAKDLAGRVERVGLPGRRRYRRPGPSHVGGYDFATVLKAHWRGSGNSDEGLKVSALRWLRGEFSTKTEARQALGVRTIIDVDSV
jgi:hypothetical protein